MILGPKSWDTEWGGRPQGGGFSQAIWAEKRQIEGGSDFFRKWKQPFRPPDDNGTVNASDKRPRMTADDKFQNDFQRNSYFTFGRV